MHLRRKSHPTGGVQALRKAVDLFSDDVKVGLPRAESNLEALRTVDLGPKRPFGVGECVLWARLAGPQFSAQVAAVVSLVEDPANHREATAAAKEVMAIKYSNKTRPPLRKLQPPPPRIARLWKSLTW
jgi:hypothetical protein